MARNEHKNDLRQLSEAYQNVYKEQTDRPRPPDWMNRPNPPMNAYGGPYTRDHYPTATKRFQVLNVGGRHSESKMFEDEFDTVDDVINSIDLPEEYGTEWAEEIKDVSNWSSEGFEDGLRRFGIDEIYEVIDIGSYEDDDLVSSHLDVPKPWPREDAEGALSNLATGLGRGLGDVVSGVSRAGLAAGGAGVAAAGGALGAALKIAKTLTADQLQALGKYALEKSAEEEEHDEYHPGYGKVEDSITIGDIIDQGELDLPLTPDLADALQNVMDTVYSKR